MGSESQRVYSWSEKHKPVKQKLAHTCGSASLKYALSLLDISVSEREIREELQPDQGEGLVWMDLVEYLMENGFNLIYFRKQTFDRLFETQIAIQAPILVIWQTRRNQNNVGFHVSVVQSINEVEIILMDPEHRDFHDLSREEFEVAWKDDDGESSFLVVHPDHVQPSAHSFERRLSTSIQPNQHASNAACLSYCYGLLGQEIATEQIDYELGFLKEETGYIDIVMNAISHGFGMKIFTNQNFEGLLSSQTNTHLPTMLFWISHRKGKKPSDQLGVIEAIDSEGAWILDPKIGCQVYLSRQKLEKAWRESDIGTSFLVLAPS